jgi:hypothetical protein
MRVDIAIALILLGALGIFIFVRNAPPCFEAVLFGPVLSKTFKDGCPDRPATQP